LKKNLNILYLIVILIGLGLNSYAQELPTACGGSIERYRVVGSPNSDFDWVIDGGEVYRYFNDSVDIQWYNIAGTRTITVTETNNYGCVGEPYSQTLVVTSPSIDIGLDEEYCFGVKDSYEFIAAGSPVTSYLWQDGETTGETFIATTSGEYWVKVVDEYGCTNADTANLLVRDLPLVDLGNDTTLCGEGESVEYDVSDLIGNYAWSDGSIDAYFTAYTQVEDQEIWVKVTDEFGCVGQDTVVVRFCGEFDIPNAFTPNEDGSNDVWEIEELFSFPESTIDVYNRWGESVFHSKGYSEPWNGTDMKNKKLPMDSYYYVIDLHNDAEPIVGTVTIIR